MTPETIKLRMREAWDTLRRVPAHGNPGFKSNWPAVVQDYHDAYGYTGASLKLEPADPRAIDRMYEVFTWFRFLQGKPHLTKALWLCAGRGPRRAGDVMGQTRHVVARWRDEAIGLIESGLRK